MAQASSTLLNSSFINSVSSFANNPQKPRAWAYLKKSWQGITVSPIRCMATTSDATQEGRSYVRTDLIAQTDNRLRIIYL